MLILLKFKQEFKKIKSNLHPIFSLSTSSIYAYFFVGMEFCFFPRPVCLCLDAVFAH